MHVILKQGRSLKASVKIPFAQDDIARRDGSIRGVTLSTRKITLDEMFGLGLTPGG